MNGMVWHKGILSLVLLMAFGFAGGASIDVASAEKAKNEIKKKDSILSELEVSTPSYIYQSITIGRRDPFRSLIVTVEKTDVTETGTDEARTPLQSYDISLLKLIAIVVTDDSAYALVILPDGKSYTVREDTKVGLHGGQVREILSDQVIVGEEFRDHKGNIKLEEVFLRLRQEGDK